MKRIKLMIAAFMVAALGTLALVPAVSVSALDTYDPLADVCSVDPNGTACLSKNEDAQDLIGTLINVLLFVVGALAVVMIIVGGILYAISNGDAGKITKAKNTIMYSVIGLIVAFLAFAIVNWVVVVL